MSIRFNLRQFLLLTLLSSAAIGTFSGSFGPRAFAQSTNPRGISIVDMARFYSGQPQQLRALSALQSQLAQTQPELLSADSITANIWRDGETLAGHEDILGNISAAQRVGSDPLSMALAIAPPSPGGTDNIEIIYGPGVESPSQAIVTITNDGLLDDSLAGIRQRFDIQVNSSGQWEIVRAGRQFRCREGRGHQDWSNALCS